MNDLTDPAGLVALAAAGLALVALIFAVVLAVKFTNQGENDEFDIKVTLRISGGSGSPITLSKTVPKLAPQESATVELPLDKQPPLDTAATIRATVAKVPGETKTDNNKSEYPVLIVRG